MGATLTGTRSFVGKASASPAQPRAAEGRRSFAEG